MATSQALKHPECQRHDNLVSVEKNIVQIVGEENDGSAGTDGLSYLHKLMKTEFDKPQADRFVGKRTKTKPRASVLHCN